MSTQPPVSLVEPQMYLDRAARRKLRLRPYFLPDFWMIDVAVDNLDCDHIIEIGPLEPAEAARLWAILRGTEVSLSEIWEAPFIDFDSDATWLAPDEPDEAAPDGEFALP